MNFLAYWLSIPRWIKQGALSSIVLYHLITWIISGLKGVMNLFKSPSNFFTHANLFQFALCFIVTTLLFFLLNKKNFPSNSLKK
ncbi:hypothetical protein V7056_11365 [Bacillus sp. JJ664]